MSILFLRLNLKSVFDKKLKLNVAFFCAGLLLLNSFVAMSAAKVQDFLKEAQVKTYDCPDDSYIPRLENLLVDQDTTALEHIDLQVFQAHWLICVGKNDQAMKMLESILAEELIINSSHSYALLNYQIGFIHDVNDDPKRCEYYRQSGRLAKDKFNDIYLSSQLGLITVCDDGTQNIGIKLGRLFSLVKMYTVKNDIESLAHIHNNIGLLYSSIGQNALAAEQYEKSYQLGLKVYEEKNQLAPLISVITAYSGSGDYENALLMIEELGRGNLKVNTPLTNSWYHYARSRHFYRTDDFENLRESLPKWKIFLDEISNKQMQKLHNWYSAALCLHDLDKPCVASYVTKQNTISLDTPSRLSKHNHFIAFMVKAHLFLEDIEAAKNSFDSYAMTMHDKIRMQQTSARILGVANLHNEIYDLEESLIRAREQKIRVALIVLLLIFSLIFVAYLTIGKSYLKRLATDKLTGLQNEQSVLAEIKKVKAPVLGQVNALAIFDVNNFTEMNSQFGYITGEVALKSVAQCLLNATRDKDIVGRVGTAQFVVCLKNIDELTANELFERILRSLTRVAFDDKCGSNVNIRSSMSVYSSDGGFADLDEVLLDIRNVMDKKKQAKDK